MVYWFFREGGGCECKIFARGLEGCECKFEKLSCIKGHGRAPKILSFEYIYQKDNPTTISFVFTPKTCHLIVHLLFSR